MTEGVRIGGNVVVRTPSWGPVTVHGSLDSVLMVHDTDRLIVGTAPLGMADLVRLLEEGSTMTLTSTDSSVTISYRVVPVV